MQQQQQLVLDYMKWNVYELNEIKDWYKGDDKLEVVLDELVSNNKLSHKTITQHDVTYNVYWNNKKSATPIITTPTLNRCIRRRPLTNIKHGGSFKSPLLSKRPRLSLDNDNVQQRLAFTTTQPTHTQPLDGTDEYKREELMKLITEKKEKLRRLKMVQLYKSKHDLNQLQILIKKWREVSQEAANQLYDISSHPDKSLQRLLDCLHIDYNIIHYSLQEDGFY